MFKKHKEMFSDWLEPLEVTMSLILSVPPCKDANASFRTAVPLEALSDQVQTRYLCFIYLNCLFFI